MVTRRMRLVPAIGRSETSFSSSSSSFQKQGGEGGERFGESEEDAQTGSGGRGGVSVVCPHAAPPRHAQPPLSAGAGGSRREAGISPRA